MDENRRTRALLLSGAAWPGAGHLYLGRRILGFLFAGVAAACLVVILWDVAVSVLAAMPEDGSPVPLDEILAFARRIEAGLPPRAGWLQLVLLGDWLLALADLVLRPED